MLAGHGEILYMYIALVYIQFIFITTNRGVSHCSLEGIADIRGEIDSKGTFIETGGSTAHGRWSYGSTQVIGMHNTWNFCVILINTSSHNYILIFIAAQQN